MNPKTLENIKAAIEKTIVRNRKYLFNTYDAQLFLDKELPKLTDSETLKAINTNVTQETWETMQGCSKWRGRFNRFLFNHIGRTVTNVKWYHLLLGYKIKTDLDLLDLEEFFKIFDCEDEFEFYTEDRDRVLQFRSSPATLPEKLHEVLDKKIVTVAQIQVPKINIDIEFQPLVPVSKIQVDIKL